jgi:hypothetical protein
MENGHEKLGPNEDGVACLCIGRIPADLERIITKWRESAFQKYMNV